MKFFSNEKENEAEYAHDDPERTQHVASEPVTVPPQRAGSPWSDRPGDAPAATPVDFADEPDADRERREGSTYGSSESATTERIDTNQAAIRDDGGFDSPTAVEPETGKPLDSDHASDVDLPLDSDDRASDDPDRTPDASEQRDLDQKDALQDDGTFESPTVAEPAVAPVPAAATESKPTGERLLPDGDAFTERFRDIQLRFVDDPKDATAEASRLVEEVVDKLTSTLKSQRDALGGNADDTEKLRVELRGYRDILNRLLSL
ncbi:hypothetical protein [Paractinoplanes atraurantiacus]|uniref:Uncharacterized protein n=1 Tax=Paractinoplanes atraurantiacus TaxID=1036182 RepID=A0A285H4N7_9ACTN|nr:hypothetical protein [Actinoplanes atraurantiacus]SNY30523.1 hypothetical protein SAMN05421748_103421 [Actinoplanes atraurantiacus]